MSAPNPPGPDGPRRARWSMTDRRAGGWAVNGWSEGQLLPPAGETYALAWRRLDVRAPSAVPTRGGGWLWLEPVLGLSGAMLGWLAPPWINWAVHGPAAGLYGLAEEILCPLLACFGGGLGLVAGKGWAVLLRRPSDSPPA
jgi:hypothetical protein